MCLLGEYLSVFSVYVSETRRGETKRDPVLALEQFYSHGIGDLHLLSEAVEWSPNLTACQNHLESWFATRFGVYCRDCDSVCLGEGPGISTFTGAPCESETAN